MADERIEKERDGARGRYVLRTGVGEAELTFSMRSPSRLVAEHTGVPEALRGQGIAHRLVERLVADARAEGVRIVPLCPYVAAQRDRHPDWADVFES